MNKTEPGTCRICGCTMENPCYHPEHGYSNPIMLELSFVAFVLLLLPKLGQGLPWWSSPVANTLCVLCRGCWLIPGQGTKIQHAK